MVVRSIRKLLESRDVVEDGPEALNSLKIPDLSSPFFKLSGPCYLNCVDLFQISLIFCCGYSLSCPEIKTNDREKDVEDGLTCVSKTSMPCVRELRYSHCW